MWLTPVYLCHLKTVSSGNLKVTCFRFILQTQSQYLQHGTIQNLTSEYNLPETASARPHQKWSFDFESILSGVLCSKKRTLLHSSISLNWPIWTICRFIFSENVEIWQFWRHRGYSEVFEKGLCLCESEVQCKKYLFCDQNINDFLKRG